MQSGHTENANLLQSFAIKMLVQFNYLPPAFLKKLIKQLHRTGKFYAILALADKLTARKNISLSTKTLLIVAKIHALLSVRNYRECIELINSIESDRSLKASIGSTYYKLLAYKALACTRTGNHDEAEQSLREAHKLMPSDGKIYSELALNLLNKGDIETAKSLIDNIKESNREKYWLLKYRLNLLSSNLSGFVFKEEKNSLKKTSDIYVALANQAFINNQNDAGKKYLAYYFSGFNLQTPKWRDDSFPHIEQIACDAVKPAENGPLVSVIMTSFNAEQTIAFAIDSVRNQSYRNLEIFIVDDVSTDNTVAIVNDISKIDPRVKLIRNEKNSGTYVSKNSAILKAQGKYITFHDSDDWHHPVRIEQHVKECEADPSLVGVYSCWIRLTENGHLVQQPWLSFLHENPSSLLINRRVFADIGYFDSVRIAADGEFIFRMKAHYGPSAIKLLKRPLALGLYHEKSLTRSGAGAYDMHSASPSRVQYWDEYSRWHRNAMRNNMPLKIDFPLVNRPFPAPQSILP